MKKLLLSVLAAATLAFAAPSFALDATSSSAPTTAVAPAGTPGAVAIGVTTPGTPVIVQPQAIQPYSFDAGTAVASFVNWLWLAFGGTVVTFLALVAQRFMKLLGVQTSQAMNDRLMEAIRNGMNDASAKFQTDVSGKFPVEVKNKIIAQGIEYAKAHQADTIKALGLDPKTGEVTEALRAKAETVIIDPMQATNPGLVANPNDDTALSKATPVAAS